MDTNRKSEIKLYHWSVEGIANFKVLYHLLKIVADIEPAFLHRLPLFPWRKLLPQLVYLCPGLD